jgi:hypothetical protein
MIVKGIVATIPKDKIEAFREYLDGEVQKRIKER